MTDKYIFPNVENTSGPLQFVKMVERRPKPCDFNAVLIMPGKHVCKYRHRCSTKSLWQPWEVSIFSYGSLDPFHNNQFYHNNLFIIEKQFEWLKTLSPSESL